MDMPCSVFFYLSMDIQLSIDAYPLIVFTSVDPVELLSVDDFDWLSVDRHPLIDIHWLIFRWSASISPLFFYLSAIIHWLTSVDWHPSTTSFVRNLTSPYIHFVSLSSHPLITIVNQQTSVDLLQAQIDQLIVYKYLSVLLNLSIRTYYPLMISYLVNGYL